MITFYVFWSQAVPLVWLSLPSKYDCSINNFYCRSIQSCMCDALLMKLTISQILDRVAFIEAITGFQEPFDRVRKLMHSSSCALNSSEAQSLVVSLASAISVQVYILSFCILVDAIFIVPACFS
jgi:hypothetical protein